MTDEIIIAELNPALLLSVLQFFMLARLQALLKAFLMLLIGFLVLTVHEISY